MQAGTDRLALRRAAARRTALVLALVALGLYGLLFVRAALLS